MFRRVILHRKDGSGMHSQLGETGFTLLWWTQGALFATLSVVEIDKVTTNGPLQWGFNGWTFYSFTQTMSFGFFFFLME
jgi:hypothetical protein